MKNKTKINFIISCIWLSIIMPFYAIAQPVNWADADGEHTPAYNITVQSGIDSEFFITINNDNPLQGNPIWQYCLVGSACGDPTLGISTSGVDVTIPTSGGGTTELTLTADDTNRRLIVSFDGTNTTGVVAEVQLKIELDLDGAPADSEVTRIFNITLRPPLDVIFVLDKSGSMDCPTTTLCSGITTNTRWEALKDGMQNFFNVLGLVCTAAGDLDEENSSYNILPGDRYSLVLFNGNEVLASNTTLNSMTDICDFWDATDGILEELGTDQSPGGATSIGAGLEAAINNRLSNADYDANSLKNIILFTDGMQNVGEWLAIDPTSGSLQLYENSAAGSVLNCNNAAGNTDCINFLNGYKVITSSVMESSPHASLLEALATDNTLLDLSDPANIPGMLSNIHTDIYEDFSPEMIRMEELPIVETDSAEFTCNKEVSRLHFSAQFKQPIAGRFNYIIKKGNKVVTDSFTLSQGLYYTNLICMFQNKQNFTSDGAWTFIYELDADATGMPVGSTDSIRLMAIADDHNIKFKATPGDGPFQVDDQLRPRIRLSSRGQAFENAIAKAIIYKPKADINHLLALHPDTASTQVDARDCATNKLLNKLENDPAFQATFNNRNETIITLEHKGDGLYEGKYDGLDVSGIYKIMYLIEGQDPNGLGFVQRSDFQTVNVRFGEVDLNLRDRKKAQKRLSANSVVIGPIQPPLMSGNGNYNLTFRPAYLSGQTPYYVGPGYLWALNVRGNNIEQVTKTENCDGGYTLDVQLNDTDANPRVTVSMFDQVVYKGKIRNFYKPYVRYKWGASLHGGISIPQDTLADLYNPGAFMEADLSYHLSPRYSIEATYGYYAFRDDFNVTGGSLYGKANIPFSLGSNFFISVAAGAGIYQPDGLDAELGLSGKLGLGVTFSPRWSLALDGGYFQLTDSEYVFNTLGLGLKFRI
jgi:hypothetical protein